MAGCTSDENSDYDGDEAELPANMPDDFEFSYQYGYEANNEMNTFEEIYTKDLIEKGEASTAMALSEDDRVSIYEKMRDVKILETPENLTNEAEDGTHCTSNPYTTHHLDLQVNGENYYVDWTTNNCLTEDLIKLTDFTDYVHEVFTSQEAYRALPNAEGSYE
ncbi:hypothetical protein [Alkalibacillus silvisoli]